MRTIIPFVILLAALLALFAFAPSAAEISMSNKNVTSANNASVTNETYNETLKEQENLMIMKQAYADFKKGNIPAVLNAFTQDGEYISPGGREIPLSGVYSGKNEIEGFFRNLSTVAQFIRFEPQEYIAKGDTVVSRGFEQGVSKLSGLEFSSDWAAIATFKSGKISKIQFFEDTASISAANPQNKTSINQTNLTDNVRTIRQEYISFSNGDLPAMLNSMAGNVEWVEAGAPYVPYAGDYKGLDQVKEYFMRLNESMLFTQLNINEFIAQGDKVVVLGNYSATAKPTGRNYRTDFVMIWTLQNGKIVKVQAFDDSVAEAAAFIQINTPTNRTM